MSGSRFALKKIVHRVAESLPPMNEYLLTGFRQNKIKSMVEYLDTHFKAIEWFKGALKYLGYTVMTPPERLIAMLDRSSNYHGKVSIQQSSVIVVQFHFEFEKQEFHATVEVPYLLDKAIHIEGTKYHPLLVIVERVINRVDGTKVAIKVARAELRFLRVLTRVIETTEGVSYKEDIPTAKIHLGKGGKRKNKKPHLVPIVLYHLCEYGWDGTLRRYGFPIDSVMLHEGVDITTLTDVSYALVKLSRDKILAVKKDQLAELPKRRVIASLIELLETGPNYNRANLMSNSKEWFKLALGEYISAVDNDMQMYQQADEHLASNTTMIDPAAASSLAAVGLDSTSLNELMFHAFYKLDEWLAVRNPNDLYSKQLGSISLMLAEYLRMVMSKQYNCIRRGTANSAMISGFMKQISTSVRYIRTWAVTTVSDASLDNWLLTIGAKRVRTFKTMEQASKTGSSGAGGVPSVVLSPHPSELAITSIFTVPTKRPIMTGTINPFAQIDADGNFIKPSFADDIKNVFDS